MARRLYSRDDLGDRGIIQFSTASNPGEHERMAWVGSSSRPFSLGCCSFAWSSKVVAGNARCQFVDTDLDYAANEPAAMMMMAPDYRRRRRRRSLESRRPRERVRTISTSGIATEHFRRARASILLRDKLDLPLDSRRLFSLCSNLPLSLSLSLSLSRARLLSRSKVERGSSR